MTTPTQPATPAGNSGTAAARLAALGSPRVAAAWALLGYVALHQFFAFVQWTLPGEGTFTGRSTDGSFRNVVIMAMPVLAVVLGVHVAPPLRAARLLATVALVEYLLSLFFGLVMLLIGLGGILDRVSDANDGLDALEYLVMGVASLTLIAVAAYVVFRARDSAA